MVVFTTTYKNLILYLYLKTQKNYSFIVILLFKQLLNEHLVFLNSSEVGGNLLHASFFTSVVRIIHRMKFIL